MTTDSHKEERDTLNYPRSFPGKAYISAWPDADCRSLADWSVQPMSTPEHQSQAPLELRAFIDCVPALAWTALPDGSVECFNQQFTDYSGWSPQQIPRAWRSRDEVYPDDLGRFEEWWREILESRKPAPTEVRFRRADGEYRWFQISAAPIYDVQGNLVRWCGINIDIDDRKRTEEALVARERELQLIVDSIPGMVAVFAASGDLEAVNNQVLQYFGGPFAQHKDWARIGHTHPEDTPRVAEAFSRSIASGEPFELETRARRHDGVYRWFHSRGTPLKDASGRVVRWYNLLVDIDDRKRAEQKLQQNEEDLRTILDAIRQAVVVLAADGTTLYANRVFLEITGRTMDDIKNNTFFQRAIHPDDEARFRIERQEGLSRGTRFELELRILHENGEYRWYLNQYNPLRDEHGQVSRWYVTGTDIDDQKKTEERLRNENLVLREEIDRTSMFEEIVGSSRPMSQVLRQVEKVAPSDSTVLILGETGTGKELIARALHRRSKRATRPFVRVNCAAIPESLVASELFGHEKGAFTGALQRRVGRFEAADGGTLFLDEVGELPMDTQIALLRVLQEREFERVGSNRPISIDVRIIAATNRDLAAAVAAGTFRQDLFYRLNVFPIAIPPLRERADDIPVLLEYFVARFAKNSGKNIRHISKDTLRMMREYSWPGNIRELQNVVERAVILTETDIFFVDENWLNAASMESARPQEGLSVLDDRELEMIEAALAECHGRISGPSGAAAKLGIPRQTLESKIRRLGIDRYGRKRPIAQ
jgi:formate hydrogenlyase transcriptional activator